MRSLSGFLMTNCKKTAASRCNSISSLSSLTLSVAVPCCSFVASPPPPPSLHSSSPTPSLPWLRPAGWHYYQFFLSACLQQKKKRKKKSLRHSHYWPYKSQSDADSLCSRPGNIHRHRAARLTSHGFRRLWPLLFFCLQEEGSCAQRRIWDWWRGSS